MLIIHRGIGERFLIEPATWVTIAGYNHKQIKFTICTSPYQEGSFTQKGSFNALFIPKLKGEKFNVTPAICIVVLGYNNQGIRVGIDAPREITILREEVFLKTFPSPLKPRRI